jgi:ParB-like chromosome segregation protein Spo0J
MAQKIEVVYKPLSWFRPYARNPRKNDAVVDRMVESIKTYGFPCPLLARSTGEICDGDLRFKAAPKAGLTEIPVILCDDWTDAAFRAFRLLVNRSVNWAEWDADLLAKELFDLKSMDFELGHTGFDLAEIDRLLEPAAGLTKPDEVPPVPETPTTQPGDLWVLGPPEICPHCGGEN